MTKNVKGLLEVLRHSINEAILVSNDVAAAMAALKRTGKCPVFSIDVVLEEAPESEPVAALGQGEDLVLGDADVDFLTAIGITDPSWCTTPEPVRQGLGGRRRP